MITWGAIRWKLRQKYSQFRSFIGGGHYVWEVDRNIRFVARTGDEFSHVLFVCGGHEKTELEWCRRWLKPNDSIVDCGANIGFFSAYLSQSVPLNRVIAVEGNPRTASICSSNLAALGISNVTVVQTILAATESEKLAIPDAPGREPWQRAVRVQTQDSATGVTTLDALVESNRIHPSLVKIDCEGYEPFILKGSGRLLESQRPAFMIECNDDALRAANSNRHELFSIFREHNYSLFHLASFASFHPLGLSCDETFPASEFNFAAIPNDSAAMERWQKSSSIDL